MLQQHILKEVKTIHDIRSMKSLHCKDGLRKTPVKHLGNRENKQEMDIKSSAALLMEKRFLKRLWPLSSFDQEEKLADISDTESQESITEAVNACGLDKEIKSTLIE
ncbi:uncharacterized protein LOC126838661 isoform X2 [Adelges cooleyi]|nr:uncharacterized protein LOC126838661 isoform X2 [Adelges cooleyi]